MGQGERGQFPHEDFAVQRRRKKKRIATRKAKRRNFPAFMRSDLYCLELVYLRRVRILYKSNTLFEATFGLRYINVWIVIPGKNCAF